METGHNLLAHQELSIAGKKVTYCIPKTCSFILLPVSVHIYSLIFSALLADTFSLVISLGAPLCVFYHNFPSAAEERLTVLHFYMENRETLLKVMNLIIFSSSCPRIFSKRFSAVLHSLAFLTEHYLSEQPLLASAEKVSSSPQRIYPFSHPKSEFIIFCQISQKS